MLAMGVDGMSVLLGVMRDVGKRVPLTSWLSHCVVRPVAAGVDPTDIDMSYSELINDSPRKH